MRSLWILGVAAVALGVHARVALADEGARLVEVLPQQTLSRTHPQVTFVAPALVPGARYFLTVERDGTRGRMALNGVVVVRPDDLARPGGEVVRVEVPLLATNVLRVKVAGHQGLKVAVHGVVPTSALPAGVGRRAAFVTLYQQSFAGRIPPRLHVADVTVTTTDGLFTLAIEQAGRTPAITATVLFNGRPVLGVLPILPGRDADQGPVLVRGTNALEVVVLGVPSSSVRVTLSGYVVDETPPAVTWDPVPDELEPSTPLRATYADAISGIPRSQVKVLLDGSQDVTAAFDVGAGEATSTVARLEALAPSAARGVHTLTAVVTDRGGLSAEAAITLVRDAPPVISTPGDLVVEQTGPEGALVSFVATATDDLDDPPPQVECVPPSGSTFPAGTTTVTCTARDSGGNVATATFLVTVRDTTPPALLVPGDIVVEQTSPAGAVVDFSVTASDVVDPAPVVDCVPPPGSVFAAGATTVNCTARDAAGNTSSATFVVTVQDTQPPIATLSPSEGSVVTVDRVPVRLTFADSGSGVDPTTIAVTIDDAPLELTLGEGEATATTPPLAEGTHVLVATLADRGGNPMSVSRTFEVALPDLVAPDRLDLPPARFSGGSSRATLLVSNASDRVPLHVRAATTTGDFALEPPLPFGGLMVLPGGSVELVVRFSPSALGARAGTLVLESNDPAEPTYTVALAGEGTRGALELTLDPGPANAVPAGSLHRLRVRAVGFDGATDHTFRGLVELRTTPVDSPLDGLLLSFDDAEQGLVVTEPSPLFSAAGPASISARLLVDAQPFELGSLALEVVRADRGRVIAVLDSGGYVPGQVIRARIFVDMGASDGSPASLADVLGAFDLRLLFDHRQLEVVSVDAGASPLGAPAFVLPGSLRLMDLNDLGALTAPLGPDPTATGQLEVASVVLRVRDGAPAGPVSFHVVSDALTTAEPAGPTLRLTPAGDPGPRLGEVQGLAFVGGTAPPDSVIVLGTLPRANEGLVDGLQTAEQLRALVSAPIDPASLGGVTLQQGAEVVTGIVRVGDLPNEVVFTPDAPLSPGEYTLQLAAGLAALDGTSLSATKLGTFRVGLDPDAVPADLDRDGELAVLDVQARRDVVTGRTPGQVPDFPPLFLQGGPGSLTLNEGEATRLLVEAVDLDGTPVSIDPSTLPELARFTRVSETTFELSIEAPEAGSFDGAVSLRAESGGEVHQVQLQVDVENVNSPPVLLLVLPDLDELVVREGHTLQFHLLAEDPDLLDVSFPDAVTFSVTSPALRSLHGPELGGDFQEHAAFTFEPDHTQAGVHEVTVEVSDRAGQKASLTLSLDVREVSQPPLLSAVAPVDTNTNTNVGDDLTIEFVATDADEGDEPQVVLQGASEQDLAAAVTHGFLRVDQREDGGERLRLVVTVLKPLTEPLTLTALASDGKTFSEPAVRVLRPPVMTLLPLTSSVPALSRPAGVVPVWEEYHATTGVRLFRAATALQGDSIFVGLSEGTFVTLSNVSGGVPTDFWFEHAGVRDTTSTMRWSAGPRNLQISFVFFGPNTLHFVNGVAESVLVARTRVFDEQGQEQIVERRAPVRFVLDASYPRLVITSFVPPPNNQLTDFDIQHSRQVELPVDGVYTVEGLLGVGAFNGTLQVDSYEVRLGGQVVVSGSGSVSPAQPMKQNVTVPAGTHDLTVRAVGRMAWGGFVGNSTFQVFLNQARVYPARPTYTLAPVTIEKNATFAYARVRVDSPRLHGTFRAITGSGRVVEQHVVPPAPEDPNASIEVDLLLELPPAGDRVRFVPGLVGLTTYDGLSFGDTPPELSIDAPRDAQRVSVSTRGFYRAVRDPTTQEVSLRRALDASILPEGQDAESLAADSPFALYFAYAFTGLEAEDVATWGLVTDALPGVQTPLQPFVAVDAAESALGAVPLRHFSLVTTRYRVSPPVFFVLRELPPGSLSPVQVRPDRIVVSIGAPAGFVGELDLVPRTFPLAGVLDDNFSVSLQLENRGRPADPRRTSLLDHVFAPGLVKRGCGCHEGEEDDLEPLDGAVLECGDTIEAWVPQPDTGHFTLYLDDDEDAPLVELPGSWNGQALAYSVTQLVTEVPQFTPGAHRVRLYPTVPEGGVRPTTPPLFEAELFLAMSNRALLFKTSPDHVAPIDCDGASPDDVEQYAVQQGDFPLDEGDAPGTPVAGGLVLLATGEERLERTDLVVPGRAGLDLVVRRTYRSQAWFNGAFGINWDLSLNDGLFFPHRDADGTVRTVVRQNGHGRISYWYRNPDGSYKTPPGHYGTLIRRADESWVLRAPDGFKRYYSEEGQLTKWEDRARNTIEFHYDAHGLLTRVSDTHGRDTHLLYGLHPRHDRVGAFAWRLAQIKDPAGRQVLYTYDALGHLIAVRTPVVTGTSTGNDFPEGRTEKYEYTTGDVHPNLRGNLEKIFSPEEVARGGENPQVVHQLFYGTEPADHLTFDKVAFEAQGGLNASGVQAGGVRSFEYAELEVGLQVEVREPNGTRHLHEIVGGLETALKVPKTAAEDEDEFFTTTSKYNRDGLLVRRIYPEGNEDRFVYPEGHARGGQRNIAEHRRVAGPRGDGHGKATHDLVTRYDYDPIYNQVRQVSDSLNRVTQYVLDYEEAFQLHDDLKADVRDFGLLPDSIRTQFRGDQNGDGKTDQFHGNVVLVLAPTVQLVEGSEQGKLRGERGLSRTEQVVATKQRWNGKGQLVSSVDPEGFLTEYQYHPEGQPDSTGNEQGFGYLKAVIVGAASVGPQPEDKTPLNLTTRYRYDTVGNLIAVVNPRGYTTTFEVNALNEVVSVTRAAEGPAGETVPKYVTRNVYDHDGRLTKAEVENKDALPDPGAPDVGTYVEREYVYDILGDVVQTSLEIAGTTKATTTLRYDGNRLLKTVTGPEGQDTELTYDHRSLVAALTRGKGTTVESTVTFQYDGNGNRTKAIDATDSDGTGGKEETLFTYDGFERLVKTTAPLGHQVITTYDMAGNVQQTQVLGHPAGRPEAAAVEQTVTRFKHDALDRVIEVRSKVGLPQGSSPLRPPVFHDHDNDGWISARFEYDARSLRTHAIEDDQQVTATIYDAAGRAVEVRDAAGNRHRRTLDPNGNPTKVESLEVSSFEPTPGQRLPERTFSVTNVFDALDRLISTTDDADQLTAFRYDSRDNLIARVDPEGNTTLWFHDGLDRVIRQAVVHGVDNDFDDGVTKLRYTFDAASRLKEIVDDNDKKTSFEYDALDRRTKHTNADATSYTFTYDADGNVRTITDPNGSTVTRRYDALERVIECTVTRGPGVVGTTRETYSYDGVGRVVKATDDNGGSSHTVEYVYDLLGRLLEERTGPSRVVSSRYSGDGKRTQVTYPSGREVRHTFDEIDRTRTIVFDGRLIATSDWAGPGLRELRRVNGNGTRLTFLNDAQTNDEGYDDVGRVVRARVLSAAGAPLVDRAYTYDRASMRTSEVRADDFGHKDTYTFDGAHRLLGSTFDQDGSPGGRPRDLRSVTYAHDGVGNRRRVVEQARAAGSTTHTYTVNEVNEYTKIGAAPDRTHDDNGNLTDDGRLLFAYDFKNRLVTVTDKATGTPIATYEYLADGRRVRKKVTSLISGGKIQDTDFSWDGPQEVEATDPLHGIRDTFVWSPVDVDQLVMFESSEGTFYAHQDARGDVVALTDGAGLVAEKVLYDDFGRAEVRDPSNTTLPRSRVGNSYLFQGRRHDAETGLLYFRARYYDPATGRFVQRDPVWDPANVGNQYTFGANNPVTMRDPSGELVWFVLGAALIGAIAEGGAEVIGNPNWTVGSVLQASFLGALEGAAVGLAFAGAAAVLPAWAVMYGGAAIFSRYGVSEYVAASVTGDRAGAWRAGVGVAGVGAGLARAGFMGLRGTPARPRGAGLGSHSEGVAVARAAAARPDAGVAGRAAAAELAILADRIQCFAADTPVETPRGRDPIEDVKVGRRVVTDETGVAPELRIERERWALFKLTLLDPDDSEAHVSIETLRPKEWLAGLVDPETRLLRFEVAEMRGRVARLDAVEPCPPIEPGPGRVVLSTFAHSHLGILRVRFEHSEAPLLVTAGHPFWNETREAWVPIGSFLPGETARTQDGPSRLVSVERLGGRWQVFNLEVEGSHTYFVAGDLNAPAVWVHNAGCGTPEVVDFSPRGKNLIFKEEQLNAGQLREKWPFRQDLNAADPPNIVRYSPHPGVEEFHVMQGNHRVWTPQNPPTGGPLTIKARIWTPEAWAEHAGHPFVPGRGTNNPALPPIGNPKKDWW